MRSRKSEAKPLTPEACEERTLWAWDSIPKEIQRHLCFDDAWAIRPDTRKAYLNDEMQRRHTLAVLLGEGVDRRTGKKIHRDDLLEKRTAFKNACAKDPIFFINNCVWTKDAEQRVGFRQEIPLRVFDYAKRLWIEPWLEGVETGEGSHTHDKSRRMIMSIYRMALEAWCFRFVEGSKRWVSTDKEDKLDLWYDFDSLLGKFRVIWDECVRYFPWLFPALPPHSDVNKLKYLRFPEWVAGGTRIDQSVWGNELKGILPSDPRGGAANGGFVDEAAWVLEIKKLLDAAGPMTTCLDMASSAPDNPANLFWKRRELKGITHNVAPWWLNPLNIEGIHESVSELVHPEDMWAGEVRGPWTKRWRSDWYNKEAEKVTSEETGRNVDIDPLATAGARIFLNYDASRIEGTQDPNDPTWDLYDPRHELQVWYDPGRGDPWSLIWVQIDHKEGWVNIVDYDMSSDKTVHYFVPMLKGWPVRSMERWRTAPEALPWREVVPWGYDKDRIARMERWNSRRNDRGGRITIMNGDFYGTTHHGSDLYSVEERLQRYGLAAQSVPSNYQVNRFLEGANEVMLRVRISGFLVDFRPEGRWPSLNECFQFWRRQDKKETRGKPADPKHDQYSHTGMAFTYGAHLLPMLIRGRVKGARGQLERHPPNMSATRMRLMDGMDSGTGWL